MSPAYRYTLERLWAGGDRPRRVGFVMLNPSTADDTTDDPTIRKCRGFAERAGFDGLRVANLYPLRATDPRDLWDKNEWTRLGPGSLADDSLLDLLGSVAVVVPAWGTQAARCPGRLAHVLTMIQKSGVPQRHLGLTKLGYFRHPLMTAYEGGLKTDMNHDPRP